MKILYIDPVFGISGDMTVGALLDLGLPFEYLKEQISTLNLDGFTIEREAVLKSGIKATHFIVDIPSSGKHHHRGLKDILKIINSSGLKENVKKKSVEMFELLAEVEGRVHGKSPEEVHFHEVGAVDSIVDIIGACIGFDYFDADRIISNKLNLGGGTVKTAHGELAVPPPAVSELVTGIPAFGDDSGFELTTPTGALIVRIFTDEFGPMPAMVIEKTGYGAGTRDIKGRANVLKIYLGETETGYMTDTVTILEAQIDDMTPEAFGYLLDRLFDIPVLDAYYTPVQMKKNRPGVLLTVIQKPESARATLDVIFRNSTTLGVRRRETGRYILERVSASVKTKYGEISVKVSARSDYSPMIAPEYEDCYKAARKHNVSLQDVQLEAINEYKKRKGK